MKRLIALLAVAGTILSASCRDSAPRDAASAAVEMKVYAVPALRSDEVRSMLQSALGGDNPVGRVTPGPGDTLVVVAPAQVQEGVRGLISGLDAVEPKAEPLQLTISYWMVVGRPLQKAPPDGPGYVVSGDSKLTAIESALATIVATQGPTEFTLMEKVQITALNSDRGIARGRRASVEQRISEVDGRVTGDVAVHVGGNALDTRIALESGQLLVMGQVGYSGGMGDAFDTEGSDDLTLYYVIMRQL